MDPLPDATVAHLLLAKEYSSAELVISPPRARSSDPKVTKLTGPSGLRTNLSARMSGRSFCVETNLYEMLPSSGLWCSADMKVVLK